MKRRFVFLDAGGTLFTERRSRDEVYQQALSAQGASANLEQVALWRNSIHDEMPDRVDGHPRYTDRWFHEFVRRFLRAANCDAEPEEVRATLASYFSQAANYKVFPDAPPTLRQLSGRGVRLAVVSNWSERLTTLLDELELSSFFTVISISAVIGHTKPDPGIFEHTMAALHTLPADCLHVGNDPVNDRQGALNSGIRALLLDRAGGQPESTDVIRSLLEVECHLDDD